MDIQSKGKVDPDMMLQDGKMLCELGQRLVEAAKSLGAKDDSNNEESSYNEGDQSDSDVSSESSGEDNSGDSSGDSSGADAMSAITDPKKRAIILAIRKKIGK